MAEDAIGFGLYVHWPFCQAKCPYCDFNSHVTARIDQARWARALAGEVARVAARTPGRRLTSIFFGGGTPSLMAPETVAAVMDAARAGWDAADDLEVTLEANPTSVEAGRFAGYRAAGVNRVSLGVQALNDADLRRLGRLHDVAQARAAFDVARRTFDRVSFDLICARQNQTRESWARELDEALAMAIDHVSLYQLTIEPGTAFAARQAAGGLGGLPDEDLGADLYEMTVEKCEAAGLALYEVSNFARPGAECRHNLLYWSGGDYAGIGPGAHGRLALDGRRHATTQEALPGKWLEAVEGGDGTHEQEEDICPSDQMVEYILMGMRKREGIALSSLATYGPRAGDVTARAGVLAEIGLVETREGRLRTTPRGRLLLDRVVAELAGC
jgi:oxygen-independent coproporphyrinogen-3 oxidase